MVAATPQISLPELSDADKSRLADCLFTEATGTELLDRYAFLARPDIAPWVAFHRAEVAAKRTTRAIDLLEQLAAASKDPIEQRRAASTILRALTNQLPLQSRSRQRSNPHSHVGSPSRLPTDVPFNSDDHTPTDTPELAPPRFTHPPNPPRAKKPAATPDPSRAPDDVIHTILAALKTDDIATLRNFHWLRDEPTAIDKLLQHYQLELATSVCFHSYSLGTTKPTDNPATNTSNSSHTHRRIIHTRSSRGPRSFTMVLVRPIDGPLANCWLFESIRTTRDTS